jgi:hypothetical protein
MMTDDTSYTCKQVCLILKIACGISILPGAVSCSDDELLPSDEDDECPPSRDQPHLRFEIKSDDGFSVEADSIEGEVSGRKGQMNRLHVSYLWSVRLEIITFPNTQGNDFCTNTHYFYM